MDLKIVDSLTHVTSLLGNILNLFCLYSSVQNIKCAKSYIAPLVLAIQSIFGECMGNL